MPRHPSKGPGHGGPAKGVIPMMRAGGAATGKPRRAAFEPGNQAAAAANRTGGDAYRRMTKAERIAILETNAFDLSESSEQDSVRSNMIQYLMNREMGTPVSKQELTGKDGAAVEIHEIRRVIVDPTDDTNG